MLMETEANAKARGAPVYCEVAGFGSAYGVELDEQLGLGAMPTADAVAAADLGLLRGGACKVGSGADFLDETVPFAGVALATVGKRG